MESNITTLISLSQTSPGFNNNNNNNNNNNDNNFISRRWLIKKTSYMKIIARVYSKSILKAMREKEKLLVRSNLSFSHNVFYPIGELSAIMNESTRSTMKLILKKV